MTKEELGILYPIQLSNFNTDWKNWFIKEKNILRNLLPDNLIGKIEHIGSTAVPELDSKPTIDILIELKNNHTAPIKIKEILDQNNYIFMKEQTRHLMFVKGYTPTGLAAESYHLHFGVKELDWLWDRIYFRDYLIEFPNIKRKYQNLKIELAIKFKHDREAYTNNKSAFIQEVTRNAKKHYLNFGE